LSVQPNGDATEIGEKGINLSGMSIYLRWRIHDLTIEIWFRWSKSEAVSQLPIAI